mgnify:CR=1 FL=1
MQPVYLAGHSRPVRKIMYNHDGDLLFTCSDDGTICMYNTYDCSRIGMFYIKEACKSFDLTKDSKYLLASATTFGIQIYKIINGDLVTKLEVPGSRAKQIKQVELALGDKQFLVLYENEKQSNINIYDLDKVINSQHEDSLI